MSDKVGMSLRIKATASVESSVKKELLVEDPTQEKAQAILRGENEDTKGDERERSSGSDQ